MAALSCYQPCRSHLAQPARCLADDEEDVPHPTFSLRRRQFERSRERCPREAAVAAGPRRARDEPPRREELTRHVREDPARHVREDPARHVREDLARLGREDPRHAGPAAPRRLNVDHGWSKVEEVRKKFEGAAAAASFSRSFESPPRRRLADSLFASFKLPRKKDGNMAASRSLAPQHQHKRKSAVELLAETKAFYVKSETVLDRKQELPLRVSSGLSQAIAQGGCHLVSSGTLNNDACCNIYATTRSTASLTRRAGGTGGCGAPLGSELQNTLRRLLEHDARQHKYPPGYATHKIYAEPRRVKDYIERETMPRSQHTSGTFSGTSSSGTSGSKAHKSEPEREKANRPLSFGDARVFFPESFVIPRQRPSEVVIKGAYSIPSSHSSPEHPQAVAVGAGEGALSPAQAHYAHSAPRYIRSNSHSQPSVRAEDGCANINSHKSLPDLHSQARQYPEHAAPGGTDTIGRSPRRRRHSTHQRTASCSSKGTRSNHSSLMSSCDAFSEHPSPGEENYQSYNSRCGSSFARDSGGSSGHYTQRSAPPHHHQHRTDSGSSTQHDQSRHNYYPCGRYSPVGPECLAPAPPQFQDGAPSPPAAPPPPHLARVGIHFQASAPPPQFQDEPPPPPHDYKDYDCTYKPLKPCLPLGRKDYPRERDREYGRYHIPAAEADGAYEPTYAEPRHRPRPDDTQEYVNATQEPRHRPLADETQEYVNTPTQICPTEEVTSPLGTFKRQRCLRYKQRRPRPILRSKSDISDRYRRTDGRSPASAPCEGDESPDRLSDESTRLEQFFERLGLDPRQYDAIVRERAPHSPVYFSSASTVDSNQLPATADYTVQGPGVQKQIYRNTEPPSVVERNARIIKWLCQCRKTQAQPPQ